MNHKTVINNFIYHYTSYANALNIIKTNEFWLNDKKNPKLNDHGQIAKRVKTVAELLSEFKPFSKIEDLETHFINTIPDPYFIGSFSHTPDNPHLWNEYAAHDGVCLQFDVTLFKRLKGKSLVFHDVFYSDQKGWIELIKPLCEEYYNLYLETMELHSNTLESKRPKQRAQQMVASKFLLEAMRNKDMNHRLEEEVRLVLFPIVHQPCSEITYVDGVAKLKLDKRTIRRALIRSGTHGDKAIVLNPSDLIF